MIKHSPLATILHDRGSLIQLFLAAVVLALGVNLLASEISDHYSNYNMAQWLLSGSLILLSIAIIAKMIIPTRKIKHEISGFIIFRRDSSELIRVPRYDYAEDLHSFITGLFSENSAPQKLWESDPIHKGLEFDPKTGSCKHRQTEAGKLIVEATEYYILEKLSTHLTDYFNQLGVDSKRIREFAREDIPDIVFRNRFLDTFSRPMRERAAFMENSDSLKRDSERVVASFGPNGARFSKFDLVLPSGAKVQRLSPGSICIETPKFRLTLGIDFSGMNTNLPRGFEDSYLGNISFLDASVYSVCLSTIVEFKPWALLSKSGWEYHIWVDSFLHDLRYDFDKDTFFNTIQWETAVTVARIMECTVASKKTAK